MLPEIRSAIDIIFCHFGPFFSLLPQKLITGKKCKKPGDIILSHICTINEDHMMYDS